MMTDFVRYSDKLYNLMLLIIFFRKGLKIKDICYAVIYFTAFIDNLILITLRLGE